MDHVVLPCPCPSALVWVLRRARALNAACKFLNHHPVNRKGLETSCVKKPGGLLWESVLGVPSAVFLMHTEWGESPYQTQETADRPWMVQWTLTSLVPFPAQACFLKGEDNMLLWSLTRWKPTRHHTITKSQSLVIKRRTEFSATAHHPARCCIR